MKMKKFITFVVILATIFNFSILAAHAAGEVNDKVETPNTEEENTYSKELDEDSLDENEAIKPDVQYTEVESEEAHPEEETHPVDSQKSNEQIEPSSEKEVVEEKSTDSLVEEKEKAEEGKSEEIRVFSNSIDLPYKQGDNHEVIIPIKVKLNALGFDDIAETGNYGSWTAKRVSEFQKYYGLSVTGEVDQKTLDKLNEVFNSPYQNGQSNSYTTEIKKMLNALGYSGLAEGPVFGNLTETRVKGFQNDNSLKAHGIVDNPTISALEKAYGDTEFQKGDNHSAVIQIKQKLNAVGFSGLALTGNYGNLTETRVAQFQSYYGLSSTGIADQKTQEKLDEVYNSPYQNGKSNSYTTEIKNMLNALGYDGLALGPVFGNLTETRVKEFQSDYGLRDHGIADDPTINALENAYNKSEFKIGDDHPAVIQIKQKLNALGFAGLALTGNYGNLTETRVTQFQSYYGLSSTGIADQKTVEKLNEVYNSPYQKGKSNSFTAEIKMMLNVLGYDGLAYGPAYGSLTETRVKQFQRDNGLKAHGIADEITIKKLESRLNDSNVLKKGDRKAGVIDLKRKLNSLGYNGLALTNNFGSLTETRVKQFQKDYDLNEYGLADKKTLDKIDTVLATSLKEGDRKAKVIQLKRDLNSLGYDGLALTNNFGSFTTTRVKQFQRDNNLPVNGIADERTLTKIENSFLKIFIDPGHGAHDPGGSSFGLKEKNVVLDIGLQLTEELRSYAGVKVMMSRTSDTYLSLSQRSNMANKWGADYFVSLHTNAAGGNGFETFIYNGSVSQETKNRQRHIHTHLANWLQSNNGIRDRGMKTANFHVLRESKMPTILLEYMFIDNAKENNLLKNKSYRNTLGKVTAEAIAKSFNLKKR